MKRAASLLALLFILTGSLAAAPRDAAAVLNRCGKPLKGDTIILENTVAGGRRILAYERGTLNFDKVALDGWTFAYGGHRGQDHLSADQMAKYLPCLKDALADSAAPEPLVILTPVQRVEVSVKRSFKTLIFYSLAGLVVLGLALLLWSRRSHVPNSEDPDPA